MASRTDGRRMSTLQRPIRVDAAARSCDRAAARKSCSMREVPAVEQNGQSRPDDRSTTDASHWCARLAVHRHLTTAPRSEERRVGKECRSRWSPEHQEKKEQKEGYAGQDEGGKSTKRTVIGDSGK